MAKRIIFIASIILLICLLISVFAIFFDIGHSCTCEDEYCSICEFYSEMRKSSALLSISMLYLFTLSIFTVSSNIIHYCNFKRFSLVSLRVKMSN